MLVLRKDNRINRYVGYGCMFLVAIGVAYAYWATAPNGPQVFTANLQASASVEPSATGQTVDHPQTLASVMPDSPAGGPKAALSLVTDGSSARVLFEKNAHQPLPVASLTKIMAALVALEQLEVTQTIAVSETAMAQEGDQGELKLGEMLSVRNLIFIMLIDSSNRAAYALSEIMGTDAFVAAMNERARQLGLQHTHFDDPTGLSSKSYSTAMDMATIFLKAYEHPLFQEAVRLKEYRLYVGGTLHHVLANTNKLLGQWGIVGGKTGWTNAARGCMIVLRQNDTGQHEVHVVLGAEDRFEEVKKLITQLYD